MCSVRDFTDPAEVQTRSMNLGKKVLWGKARISDEITLKHDSVNKWPRFIALFVPFIHLLTIFFIVYLEFELTYQKWAPKTKKKSPLLKPYMPQTDIDLPRNVNSHCLFCTGGSCVFPATFSLQLLNGSVRD